MGILLVPMALSQMKHVPLFLLFVCIFSFSYLPSLAAESLELRVDKWVHLPEGDEDGPSLQADWKGKVIYLYFFQAWCPGCHSSGFPTLRALLDIYGDNEGIRFAAVQTVFEGFHTNTADAAREIVKRYDLQSIPVGQSGLPGKDSKVMRDFKTRGTPWTVIINPEGEVIYSGFHLDVVQGKQIIEGLF